MSKEDLKEACSAMSRRLSKKYNKGKKCDIWVCGLSPTPWSSETKCKECGRTCHYTADDKSMMKQHHKKICGHCVLNIKKYRKNLSEEEVRILEVSLGIPYIPAVGG